MALRGPLTKCLVIKFANARAAPVLDQIPNKPPSNQRYNNKIAAALSLAKLGTNTLSVRSYRPNIIAPTITPANKAVRGSRVIKHKTIVITAGNNDQAPK